jgi:hypothetical protein
MICRSTTAGRCLASALAVTLILAFAPARANDSSAAMAAGGLELIKNDQVRMVSEVLRIAPRMVEVNYVFENTGASDVTTLVAFPLPELPATYESLIEIAFPQAANFVGFQAWIDGKEIKPDIEVRAFDGAREVTADLKRLGIDIVAPRLDDAAVEKLRALDLVEGTNWVARVSFHWSQTFPAGKQVTVRHRYRPIYGSRYSPVDARASVRFNKDDQSLGGQWCLDKSFNDAELRLFDRQYDAADRNKNRSSNDFMVYYDNVQYVLKTGANWEGAIGRFELQIDKGGADLVSICPIPGLTLHRAPYGFSAVATDYMPVSNLDILFVSGHFLGQPDGTDPRQLPTPASPSAQAKPTPAPGTK